MKAALDSRPGRPSGSVRRNSRLARMTAAFPVPPLSRCTTRLASGEIRNLEPRQSPDGCRPHHHAFDWAGRLPLRKAAPFRPIPALLDRESIVARHFLHTSSGALHPADEDEEDKINGNKEEVQRATKVGVGKKTFEQMNAVEHSDHVASFIKLRAL